MHTKDQFDTTPQVKQRLNRLPVNPEKADPEDAVGPGRFPSWLHRPLPKGSELFATNQILRENRLHTVCEEAKCPNLLECYSRKTATFLVMGKECTRSCGFCSIDFSKTPEPLSADEPQRVADSVQQLGLKHVVITMVARDDLADGGAKHLCQVVEAIRKTVPDVTVELLTSDFDGKPDSWDVALASKPEIFNHNIETVRELTPRVRHKATYERTLSLLRHAKDNGSCLYVKSGIMVGLGETQEQVHQTLHDLHHAGCDIVTIGQYLQAGRTKLRLQSFVTPDQFAQYEAFGHSIGIKTMYCGPFVRSSYNANLVIQKANGDIQTINSV
jgi:lipoic acid synthetase